MKAPRREFVVEYKSTRRQIKAQPKSIWGNLDLGAVARQVDAVDVLPVVQPTRPEPVETQQVEHVSASNVVIDTAKIPDNVEDLRPSADANPETVDAVLPLAAEVSIETAPLAEPAAPLAQRKLKRRSAPRKPSRHSVRFSLSTDAMDVSMPPADLDDDIAALDAENRRLKRLMADKLRNENGRLQSILDRLEKIPAICLG